MRRVFRSPLAAFAAAALAGCGYVGDPLPPALNIPVPISDLTAAQRGEDIVIRFTVSNRTTENLLLKRRGPVELEVAGRLIPVETQEFGPVEVKTPARPHVNTGIMIRARVRNEKGRPSDWSPELWLNVAPPVEPPRGLKARGTAGGVELAWSASRAASFQILRNGQPLAVSSAPSYLDASAAFGETYEYSVRALADGAESELSPTVRITHADRFPPAAPSGLQAVTGPASVELVWEGNSEPDLKGYRVYRSAAGGPWSAIASDLENPAYSDRSIQAATRFTYRVTAVDQNGNESAPSETVEVAIP